MNGVRRVPLTMLFLPALACLTATTAHAQSREEACSDLAERSGDANNDLQISEARFYAARSIQGPGGSQPLPPHCHVAGSFEHRTGVNGAQYAIKFAMNLPENWNGRFLFQGGGGLNGAVREPTGATAAGGESALARGFAVVSTDSGHEGAGFDASFMADQQALLNFQFDANAKTTRVTRPIVEAYYGSAPHHSYFVGCSTGGREGMIMAERFPQLFDGIVSGSPAMRTTISNLGLRWINAQYAQAKGTKPRDPFTKDEEELIMGALLKQCDAKDGLADGLIFNRSCDFDPRDLACSSRSGEGSGESGGAQACLADDKAEALARAMGGPVTANGTPVYVSYPYDAGIDDTGGLPGLLIAGGSPPIGGSGADSKGMNVAAELQAAIQSNEAIGSTAYQYNVSSFIGRGGKHIFYHGEADPWFSANDTVRYFEAMGESNRSVAPVENYARLYLVPGMAHCAGGEKTVDSFDLLTPLVDWVEKGEAPAAVMATGRSMPGQSRPLCPFPSYAYFKGGDAADGKSFECRMP